MNTPNQVKVWDPLIRIFHWTLVVCFFIAYFTEDDLQWLHVWAGYYVGGLLVFRLVWGFVGSRHARFIDFIFSPGKTLIYLKDVARGKAARYIGHNPAGAAMIFLLLISIMITVLSGVAYYGGEQWLGPMAGVMKNVDERWMELLEEIHELFANVTVFLVVLHVLGVILESISHRENLILSMFTGRKRAD